MALRIFETDPDAKPKQRVSFADDFVGRFRSGRMVGTGRQARPESLNEWRVTTGDPVVAAKVAELFGGTPGSWDTDSEDSTEILTEAPSVPVIIDSADALTSDMRLYGAMGGEPIHWCDGMYFLDEDQKGQPCGCPELLVDRKALAKSGRGPKPAIVLVFRLADAPDLGKFRFRTGSWDLAKVEHEVKNALDEVGAPARSRLTLEPVEFIAKNGPMKGKTVSYTKPVIKVLGAYEPAVPVAEADDPWAALPDAA
ncbi:hypothetical protein [Streptomyces sp. CB03911]|uniref:recombination directionality factor n=1 Tax=Streptomyces sp. CB03911 TaxID=1804758 RepID=UPI00093FCB60|nr:hypothetical protein [Streptomyces sp. CB03911]OKI19284.1 hypothetical protein A6A07_07220 [Streptomyces sp. CB03911]